MQILIASSLYHTTVGIRRLEVFGLNFHGFVLKYKQCFYESIINNDTNHKNKDAAMSQSYCAYFNSIGTKRHTLPRCGLVTTQIARHIWCSMSFWCGFVCQGVFFLTSAVLQSCRFHTDVIVHNFKLQYLKKYSSDSNNLCRFQFVAVCTIWL